MKYKCLIDIILLQIPTWEDIVAEIVGEIFDENDSKVKLV